MYLYNLYECNIETYLAVCNAVIGVCRSRGRWLAS